MRSLAIVFACVGLSIAVAHGNMITNVVTDGDAWVRQDYSGAEVDKNWGGDTALTIGGRYGSVRRFPYLHFDLSGLNDALPVLGATLELTGTGKGGGSHTGTAYVFCFENPATDWDLAALPEGTGINANTPELDITLRNAPEGPAVSGAGRQTFKNEGVNVISVGTAPLDEGPTDISLDITPVIEWALGQNAAHSAFAAHTDLTFGLRFDANYNQYDTWDFASREATPGDDTDAPQIVVTQLPEPATLALLLIGGAALIRRRR